MPTSVIEKEQTRVVTVPYKLNKKQKIYILFKNCIEWFIALISIIVLSPFWLVLFIAIKIDSKGPAIFKHSRIGKNRKLFKCCKWRSMSITTPKHIASRDFNDAEMYITKVGAFIRKTSIDEFGQLFNILTGEMSLIGYRPLVAKENDIDELREKYGIYQIKPGITGWAQVNGRDLVMPEEKAQLDAYYLQNISLKLDIKIFFLTIKKIFKGSDIKEGKIEIEENNNVSEKVKS